jgi:broad specificity phosphatase PhoE
VPSKFDVYLVRHGESAANLDKGVNLRTADHAVPLSQRGHEEAVEAGIALAALIGPELAGGGSGGTALIAAYVSPYMRTRQTWNGLKQGIASAFGFEPVLMETESIFLREPRVRPVRWHPGQRTAGGISTGARPLRKAAYLGRRVLRPYAWRREPL